MMMFRRSLCASFAAALLASGAALAETPVDAALPAVQHAGDVAYLTGGIGSDESDAIKSAAGRWPLSIEMARLKDGRGEFVADVDVAISQAKGKPVFAAKSDGPYMLVKLPPGSYKVQATFNGMAQQKTVTVGKGSRHVAFLWPEAKP